MHQNSKHVENKINKQKETIQRKRLERNMPKY